MWIFCFIFVPYQLKIEIMSITRISKKFLELQPNDKDVTHLKVEVYYDKGGANYFSGYEEARGIKLSISPVKREEQGNGIVVESYVAFRGFKKVLKEMSRYNKKVCDTFSLSETEEQELIKHVLNHNWLKLK
jgi:hypothetical protein